MEQMELDVKSPPPPLVAYTDDQLRLAKVHRVFARVEEIIAAIDAVAAQVRKLRPLRAEGLGVDHLAAPVAEVEWAFGRLSAMVRRVAAMRGAAVEVARVCIEAGGGGEAADLLADALQRIHIDLS